jgi:hypothetical protein
LTATVAAFETMPAAIFVIQSSAAAAESDQYAVQAMRHITLTLDQLLGELSRAPPFARSLQIAYPCAPAHLAAL